MLNLNETTNTLFNRGIAFTLEEYLYCLNVTLGEDKRVAYSIAYDIDNYKKVIGTEQENKFLDSHRNDCALLEQSQNIIKLKEELHDLFIVEVQSKAMNLEDYKFTGGQIAQILQNLLHNRISDLDSASTKDVISLIKLLTEQFGLDGGSDFEKHFIQIYPKFNALCTNCNKEFQISEGISAICPHCGAAYYWNEKEKKFIPNFGSL